MIWQKFNIKQYKVLQLNILDTPKYYGKYRIDGKTFDIVSRFDLPNCIAIKSSDHFSRKTVAFFYLRYAHLMHGAILCHKEGAPVAVAI